jgi:putative ABC transport system ATP-binding protein
MPALEARALCKHYGRGVHALDDVTLTIATGSFTALTGPSGSGKTTLLTLLGALDYPTKGAVLFDGRDLGQCSDAERTRVRRRMGFTFQSFSLVARLPAWENISYPLIPRGVPRAERYRRAIDLLARLGLEDRRMARPEELSGGEQQRVGLARALAGDPEVLIADEPTSNLDPQTADVVASMLRERHTRGATVLVASHDPQLLGAAGAVYTLEGGRILSIANEAAQSRPTL